MRGEELARVLRVRQLRLGAAERALARSVTAARQAAESSERASRLWATRLAAREAAASELALGPAEAHVRLPWAQAARQAAARAGEAAAAANAHLLEAEQARCEAARALAAARQRVDQLGQTLQRHHRRQQERLEQAADDDRPLQGTES